MELNQDFLGKLFEQAKACPSLCQDYELRTSPADPNQRVLKALLSGTVVPIHRHPNSTEDVLLLRGKLVVIIYEEVNPFLSFSGKRNAAVFEKGMDAQNVTTGKRLREVKRIHLDPKVGNYGCVVAQGVWHTVESLIPSVIYVAKDGREGEDGTENLNLEDTL